MSPRVVNRVVDRLVYDDTFARRVLIEREARLQEYALSREDAAAAAAVRERDSAHLAAAPPYATLRTLARYQPLAAAARPRVTRPG
jgi:hypothetical protein